MEYLKTHGPEEEQEYYQQFGFEKLDVTGEYITQHFERLTERFNRRYAERHINRETLELWQNALQNKMDEVAPKFDIIYEEHNNTLKSVLLPGTHVKSEGLRTAGGRDSKHDEQQDRSIDTPDSIINHDDNYADSLREGEADGYVDYGRTDADSRQSDVGQGGAEAMRSYNAAIRLAEELDTSFIAQFENLFLNVFDYDRGPWPCP